MLQIFSGVHALTRAEYSHPKSCESIGDCRFAVKNAKQRHCQEIALYRGSSGCSPGCYLDERSSAILNPQTKDQSVPPNSSELGNRTRLPVSQCAIPHKSWRRNSELLARKCLIVALTPCFCIQVM